MKTTVVAACLVAVSLPVAAETIVAADAKPSVATAWRSEGDTVILTVKSGFSPTDVADAIRRGIPRVIASPAEGEVRVKGIDQDALLLALERIEVDPELDDIDEMFAAIRTGPEETVDEGSGSSIRATRATGDAKAPPVVTGQVKSVHHKRFPLVAVTLVLETGAGDLEAGQSLTIVPVIGEPSGPLAEKNLAAWYARPGDRIRVELTRKTGKYWVADKFDRLDSN